MELRRFLVFRPGRAHYLCVCAARDGSHALRIARQMFTMPRGSQAVPESGMFQAAAFQAAWDKQGNAKQNDRP